MQPNDQERAQLRSAIDAELEQRKKDPNSTGSSKKTWLVELPGMTCAVRAPLMLLHTEELIAIRDQMDKEDKRHAR